ncbi:MAG TPA: DJ-1/PfpI family protein [Bacillus sp. (in: firmicutes)]|nr:DJ-1/PfpI family protein [Bacillus sp. (in: firmicutes)]
MRLFVRIVVYISILTMIVGGLGWVGYSRSQSDFYFSYRDTPVPSLEGIKKPEYDPNKPTVAVVLGNGITEVFDFLAPYEILSMTGAFNVFAVAPDKNVKPLSGGLDVIPHYSYAELDHLLGKSPDILVVPNIRMDDKKNYEPVRKWIQKHATPNNTILSICSGARNLADAGVLDGKSATIHWSVIDKRMKEYPAVQWKRDQRYVQDGNIISSAGLSSGIDAILYVISQKLGEPTAEKIAKEMNYPTYHFLNDPKVDPFYKELEDSIYYLNHAFQWNKNKTGVLLYSHMEIGALASIFDTYGAIGTHKLFTISSTDQPIVTKYGLNLLARYSITDAPKLDRMIVSGTQAKSLAAKEVSQWKKGENHHEVLFMHSDEPNRYVYEAPLEDLAKQEDIQIAEFAAKRFEYRGNNLKLEGKPISLESYGHLLLLYVLSLSAALYIDKRFLVTRPSKAN